MKLLLLATLALCALGVSAETCPFLFEGTPPNGTAIVPTLEEYDAAVASLDIPAVIADIVSIMTDSQECWPADNFGTAEGASYGGLFIRLAWHCSGSFRSTDDVGGCTGGHQRFPPESAWEDNTNLDKARALLGVVKQKYGDALSWGDLMTMAGTAAILHMGGPVTEVCAGRVDEPDGSKALPLGPSDQAPACPIQGDCREPIGASVIGLIYVNPEGYMGVPNREHSALQIRNVFARMDMNDLETVALIGGGHAFGKAHGACPDGAGPDPSEQPGNPWPGNCGTGKGRDTFTSGIEGPWTSNPFRWDNEFFVLLNQYADSYEVQEGPGGSWQWKNENTPGLMMMTTDLALTADESYRKIVSEFAQDLPALEAAFSAAWEKLVTRGGTWSTNKHCWNPNDSSPPNNDDPDNANDNNSGVGTLTLTILVVLGALAILGAIAGGVYWHRNKRAGANASGSHGSHVHLQDS